MLVRHMGHAVFALVVMLGSISPAAAEQLPWQQNGQAQDDSSGAGGYAPAPPYQPAYPAAGTDSPIQSPSEPDAYGSAGTDYGGYSQQPTAYPSSTPPAYSNDYGSAPQQPVPPLQDDGYSIGEINGAGHRFFGKITKGLASVIEYAFQKSGRPNGYILGEEGSGAFIAGVRYGEGTLYTKNAGNRKVYWQGPSIGYDFGAEGSKAMILVYNMYSPDEVFYDYAGVGGQAYVVGGAGITYLKSGHVTMAPIRSGLGLRLGANVGYLKFTRAPTWNPF